MKKRLLYTIVLLVMLIGCKQEKTEQKAEVVRLPESFLTFYEQFHTDSTFQLEHIIFPLSGRPSHRDTTRIDENFFWQQTDWTLHRPFDPENSTFVQTFELVGEHLVVDLISTPDGSMYMERRFADMADGWHLIYFADLRMAGYD